MSNMLNKLQFKGFAEETVRLLSGIHHFKDLMELDLDDASFLGDLTSKSLISQIEEFKNTPQYDYKVIGALGFSDIAIKTWKLILSKFDSISTMVEMYKTNPDMLIEILKGISGIGPATANTIVSEMWYFIDDIDYMINNITLVHEEYSDKPQVRFTGIRDREFSEFLNHNGYDSDDDAGVTKKTSILVVPYEGYQQGNKYAKAKKYGTKIVPIDAFKVSVGYL